MTKTELREKLAQLLKNHPCNSKMCTYCKEMKTCNFYEKSADHLIANGVTFAKDNDVPTKWISVKDRLPEDDDHIKFYDDGRLKFASVIVFDKEKGVCTANRLKVERCGIEYLDRFSTNGWRWSMGAESVTHWTTLPEPPKGD